MMTVEGSDVGTAMGGSTAQAVYSGVIERLTPQARQAAGPQLAEPAEGIQVMRPGLPGSRRLYSAVTTA